MQNILGEDDAEGFRLLRCVRAYTELDMFASFDVHTDVTIKQGRAAATKFSKYLKVIKANRAFSTDLKNAAFTNILKLPGI
jgi:microcystin degradation protein MlrC